MPRLTDVQWEEIRADFEVGGLSLSELAQKHGINKSNISRRASKEAWDKEQTQQLISATVENKKENILLAQQAQQLPLKTQQQMQQVVFDRLAFELQNDADLKLVRDKAIEMLALADKMGDVKAVNEVLLSQRAAYLGKAPDTAIAIQTAPSRIERVIIDAYRD